MNKIKRSVLTLATAVVMCGVNGLGLAPNLLKAAGVPVVDSADLQVKIGSAATTGGTYEFDLTNMLDTTWSIPVQPSQVTNDTTIILTSDVPLTLHTGSGIRHFRFNISSGITLTLDLRNITLDGGSDGGGIGTNNSGTFEFVNGKIANCDNGDGGGIDAVGGNVIISGGEIINNKGGEGGGVYADETIAVSGGIISGNSGSNGGGIYAGSDISITGGTISNNEVTATGGGAYSGNSITVSGGTISHNLAGYGGGGITAINTIIHNGTISGNSGANGGGIRGAAVTINGGTIAGNTANNGGGVWGDTVNISGGTIVCNTAVNNGGGIYADVVETISGEILNNSATNGGGIFLVGLGPSTMAGSRFAGNLARSGSYTILDSMAVTAPFNNWSALSITKPHVYLANNDDVSFTNLASLPEFTGPTFYISFMRNDGTDTEVARISTDDATSGSFPEDPSRQNYRFTGWNTLAGGGGQTITRHTAFANESIKVYAAWQPADGNNRNNSGSGNYGNGYQSGGGEITPDHSNPHKGGTLATIVYQVRFDNSLDSTGYIPVNIIRVKAGGYKVPQPKDPVRAGYVFAGWCTDKQRTKPYDFDRIVSKSFTLYAKWDEATATEK